MVRLLIIFAALLVAVSAKVTPFTQCSANQTEQCEASEVRIEPCRNIKKGGCTLKKGEVVTVAFDFTPNFTASQLKNVVVWEKDANDVPWVGLEKDGCKSTSCPIDVGKNQTYSYNLQIGNRYPEGTYNVRWEVNDVNDQSKSCCFKTTIRIKK